MATRFVFISIFLLTTFLITCIPVLAQVNKAYKIAVYEKRISDIDNPDNTVATPAIRNLFVKNGDEWRLYTDSTNETFNAVYKGKILCKIKGICCPQDSIYNTNGDFVNAISDVSTLNAATYLSDKLAPISKPFKEDEALYIERCVFLSNYQDFKRRLKLVAYKPLLKEIAVLSDSAASYIARTYLSNKACSGLGVNDWSMDSIAGQVLKNSMRASVDYESCVIDNQGNKLIRVLIPANPVFSFYYPFSDNCYREDSGYSNYAVMCYLDKNGKLIILQDLLQLMDSGDFDGDGKDEYLFWSTRFNNEGYVMYYDGFRKHVKCMWHFH